MGLIDGLIRNGYLKTSKIIEAFQRIKRKNFLPDEMKNLAELNEALPIDYGQTISQPLVVAFMLEKLQPEEGNKILDIGSGSGWTSALLAEVVGKEGKIISLEIIPELKEFGEKNVDKYNFIKEGRVQFFLADGLEGCREKAPFDRILCSAAVQGKMPKAWEEQLKVGGRIATPIGSSIWVFVKKSKEDLKKTEYPGFSFVPLVENAL
ncbi:MAG: protein-L-isoaspartate O-methyltransferase [Candidatus Nealsonbacteria bacterium]